MDLSQIEHIAWLQPLFETMLFGNSLGHYLLVTLAVALVYSFGKILSFLLQKHAQKFTARTRNQIDDMVLGFVHRSLTFILVLAVAYAGLKWLILPENVDSAVRQILFIALTLKLASEIEHFLQFLIEHYLLPMARRQKGFVKTFIPPLLHLSRFIVWSFAFLLILNNLGYNITSLIAGLGIGGIALALAAQETLGNAFGSLSILTDQPFKLNDFVQIGEHSGTVKNVGLRSTEIESLTGSMLSIPNKIVANEVIDNFTERKSMGVKCQFGLEYGTSSQAMNTFLSELSKQIKKTKNVVPESVRAHFVEFGASSLELEIFYLIKNPKFNYVDFLDCKQKINLKILELADKLKLDIAFPTQSIYLKDADASSKTRKN